MKKRKSTRRRSRAVTTLLSTASPRHPGRAGHSSEHIEIRIWLRLLSSARVIENVLNSRLRREFGSSLARFDVLAQLDRFEHGLIMTELSRHLLVSNGAVTGIIERLAAE